MKKLLNYLKERRARKEERQNRKLREKMVLTHLKAHGDRYMSSLYRFIVLEPRQLEALLAHMTQARKSQNHNSESGQESSNISNLSHHQ